MMSKGQHRIAVRLATALAVCVCTLLADTDISLAQESDTNVQPSVPNAKTDPQALLRLADLYFEGKSVPRDLQKAFLFYSQAAEADVVSAKLRIGEMLAHGQGVAPDPDRGRQIISQVAETGNVSALLILGDLYSRGDAGPMDATKAIKAFEKAAALGNQQAMLRLGDLFRYGRFRPPEYAKAGLAYRRVADQGDAYGLRALGSLYVEGLDRKRGSPSEGLALLEKAAAAGIEYAAIDVANAHFYGHGMRRSVEKGLSVLSHAANQGNATAALEIVSIYRDGKRDGRTLLIKRDLARARALLHEMANRIAPERLALEQFQIDCSAAEDRAIPLLYNRLRQFSSSDQSAVIRDLRRAKPNLYVYFVQSRLKEMGAFNGKSTGKLNQSTARAFARYCRRTGTPYFCAQGPMSGQNAELLSYAF